MSKFIIRRNNFLNRDVQGYFHQEYTGYNNPGNPNFINTLKNTFRDESRLNLLNARNTVENILVQDIPLIMRDSGLSSCVCVSVPRSKALNTYSSSQLYFKEAVSMAARRLPNVIDGTDVIERRVDTYTTHLDRATRSGRIKSNYGDKPYRGITKNTCYINRSKIAGKDVILIDDIYTYSVNVDEDCIQALLDNGARSVTFFSIGYTVRRY